MIQQRCVLHNTHFDLTIQTPAWDDYIVRVTRDAWHKHLLYYIMMSVEILLRDNVKNDNPRLTKEPE